jgi:hypothetical protein
MFRPICRHCGRQVESNGSDSGQELVFCTGCSRAQQARFAAQASSNYSPFRSLGP